jgi:hypothetical protein
MPKMTMKEKLIAGAGTLATLGFFAAGLASVDVSKAHNYGDDDQVMHEASTMFIVGLVGGISTPLATLITLYCLAKREEKSQYEDLEAGNLSVNGPGL